MYIYAIGTAGRKQKIGFSKNPERRLKTLQTANSEPLLLHHKFEIGEKDAPLFEKHIHRENNHKRIKGEWFDMDPSEVTAMLTYYEIMIDSTMPMLRAR